MGKKFYSYYIRSNVRSLNIEFDSQNHMMGAQAFVSTGIDKSRSKRYAACDFVENVGFVDKRTKPEYLQFLLEDKEARSIFDNKVIRNALVKTMGLTRFRLLRKNTSWFTEIFFALKRYIVVKGCERYRFEDEEGILIIDTFTGNILGNYFL